MFAGRMFAARYFPPTVVVDGGTSQGRAPLIVAIVPRAAIIRAR